MRLIVYFDLPTITPEDRGNYTKFHKFLIKSGFVMMQESVYSKIALNPTAIKIIRKNLSDNRPPKGNIQILSVSEHQYQDIEILVGEKQKEIVDSVDRFVIL